jgi:hypothetical protein
MLSLKPFGPRLASVKWDDPHSAIGLCLELDVTRGCERDDSFINFNLLTGWLQASYTAEEWVIKIRKEGDKRERERERAQHSH